MNKVENYTYQFHSHIFIFLAILFLSPNILSAQNLYINEFMASNVISTPEIVDYDDYSDWIEIYNDSSASINLSGYYITDNLNNPTKWQIPVGTSIPPKGFLIFWADGYDDSPDSTIKYYHLNFSLSNDGEEIGLFSPDQILIDAITFGPQISDVSYGRQPDGANNWLYFGESTPDSNNVTKGTSNTGNSPEPEISLPSGIYSGNQDIEISTSSGYSIRYTIDGSMPKISSARYASPIVITSTTTLRVRTFNNNKLPSKIVTKSYFIDVEQNLPILSLTAFPETLFGPEIGIYTNEIKSREVPVNAQLFEMNGEKAFEVDAGIRLTGQYSYMYPQKSLTIKTDDKFGSETIDYPVFSNRPFEKYTSIYLRNSGLPDNVETHFRDAFQHSIVINQMDLDCQAYRPVATYINGEYWGIYNIREKLDENYLVAHHGVNPDNIDYLEYDSYDFGTETVIIKGNTDEFGALQDYLASHSMNIEANWDYVKSQIDVNEVMNYLITEIYCNNTNWPHTNSRWWRDKSGSGKWRYIFLDSDYGFREYYPYPTLEILFSQPDLYTFLFRKLFENKDFKNKFIQRFATYLNTLYTNERVVGILDSLQNEISSEMVEHIDRWNDYSEGIADVAIWNSEVGIMRKFAEERPQNMKQNILEFYDLSGVENVKFNSSDTDKGEIKVTGINVVNGFTGEYFIGVPMKIEATPAIGYKFVQWIGVTDSLSQSTFYTPSRSDSTIQITAVFEEDNTNVLPSIISDSTTLDISGSPYLSKGDVIVNAGVTLTLEPGVELLMPEAAHLVVNGILKMNGTEEDPIIIRPNEYSGFDSWGIIYFDSTSGESTLNNVQLIGATNGDIQPNQMGAISSYKSDLVIENTTILDAPFPIFTQFGNIVIRNCDLHSEKISDLINIKYAETALVENCNLRGNNSYDSDAIDYDQISNGIIRGNKIYNFYGFNSDGIDLGEGSKDILIENNLILNCNDKAISVGQASTANIKNNIIVNCAQGVGIKDDSSYALIDRNTFFGCDYGVASFEKNLGAGGGNAEIMNSIFSKSVIAPVFVDDLSILNVSYSLSDTEILNGTGNLNTTPLFKNNFRLSSNSPAINVGNPLTELDADGTRADLGAKYFNGEYQPLIINEIHYNPNNGDNYEFIEVYNSGNEHIDISEYKISGAINFTFPNSTIIDSKDFVIIAKDITLYQDIGVDTFSWDENNLSNTWGNISLINNLNEEIDFVCYSNKFDWPSSADGGGYSLELRNPIEENLVTENWKPSDLVGGSPGLPNKLNWNGLLFINEFQADNVSTIKDEFNEYDDWIEIYNASNQTVNLGGLYITDNYSNLTKHQILNNNDNINSLLPKEHILLWADGITDQGINHLSFKLSSNGEEIALVSVFENDTTIVDSISFPKQEKDFSYARENDGENYWQVVKAPTPEVENSKSNLFKKGILLVNGFSLFSSGVISAYENNTFSGNYKIDFWDLLVEPSNGYYFFQDPIGHGEVPLDTLANYSTVIWTGENRATEKKYWNDSALLEYVKMGGNLFLLAKNGRGYLNEEMLNRIGINWAEPENAEIANCIPVYEGLNKIDNISSQFLCSVFDTTFSSENSRLLFKETLTYPSHLGIGVWNKPTFGGWYKENGGQIVFLGGRAYRYDNEDLKQNVEYILKNFFMETKIVSVDDELNNIVIKEYKLNQNYPNPFNPSTVIKYDLVKSSKVELKIYNILGQEVKTLVNDFVEKGSKTVTWNGNDNLNKKVSSGIYFYRISANEWSDIKKMVFIK